MKPIVYFLIIILLAGCATRTEFGRRRLGSTSHKTTTIDSRVYNLIDTTKLYEILSAVNTADGKPLTSLNKTYLKFYANGRVGTFYTYQRNNPEALNPKRAEIGYYEYTDNKLQMRSYFEHPQGGGWIKREIITLHGDTLYINSQNVLSKYLTLPIPASLLLYKPDW